MDLFKFISYEPTPNAKQMGFAVVTYNHSLILRYKIIPLKTGMGFFIASPSCMINDVFKPAFAVDSGIEKEAVESMIRTKVNEILIKETAQKRGAY